MRVCGLEVGFGYYAFSGESGAVTAFSRAYRKLLLGWNLLEVVQKIRGGVGIPGSEFPGAVFDSSSSVRWGCFVRATIWCELLCAWKARE